MRTAAPREGAARRAAAGRTRLSLPAAEGEGPFSDASPRSSEAAKSCPDATDDGAPGALRHRWWRRRRGAGGHAPLVAHWCSRFWSSLDLFSLAEGAMEQQMHATALYLIEAHRRAQGCGRHQRGRRGGRTCATPERRAAVLARALAGSPAGDVADGVPPLRAVWRRGATRTRPRWCVAVRCADARAAAAAAAVAAAAAASVDQEHGGTRRSCERRSRAPRRRRSSAAQGSGGRAARLVPVTALLHRSRSTAHGAPAEMAHEMAWRLGDWDGSADGRHTAAATAHSRTASATWARRTTASSRR